MSYRLKKFVRRNKGPVIATCLVLMALMAGMFGTIVGLIQAHAGREAALQAEKAERQQRHVALENLQKARDAAAAEEQAKIAAQKSEAETRAVLYFLERTIFGKGPLYSSERFQTATLREAIESVAAALDKEFEKQPLVEARLRRTVGWSFWFMAENKKAAEHFEKSLRLYTVHRGPDHPDTILGQTILAGVYHLLGRDPEAVKLREDALSRQKAKFGLKHHRTIDNMNELATLYFRLGRDTDAFAILDEWIQHGVAPKNAEMFFVPLGRQLRALQKAKDGAGCRRMAELLEKSQPLDAPISLYHAARFRAVTAAVLRDADKSEKGLQAAAREADQAMAWLEQAVALGFNGVVAIKRSPDLQALRDREDFRQLVATLETGSGKK